MHTESKIELEVKINPNCGFSASLIGEQRVKTICISKWIEDNIRIDIAALPISTTT